MRNAARSWLLRLAGGALLIIGLIPLSPLIWLLVLVRGPAPWPLHHVRLAFWQTQGLGVVLALTGLALIWTTTGRDHSSS